MNTSYQEIYSIFFGRITDLNFLSLSEEDINEHCKRFLINVIPKFKKCKQDLTKRDDDLEQFNLKLKDNEKQILAVLMVVEWITPQVYNILNLKQFLGDKDFKYYSQANHLDKLMALRDSMIEEADKAIVNYTYEEGNWEQSEW